MNRAAYMRAYYWRTVERRRAIARRVRKEWRVRMACRDLGIEYCRHEVST